MSAYNFTLRQNPKDYCSYTADVAISFTIPLAQGAFEWVVSQNKPTHVACIVDDTYVSHGYTTTEPNNYNESNRLTWTKERAHC